jgi:hypothetical protein
VRVRGYDIKTSVVSYKNEAHNDRIAHQHSRAPCSIVIPSIRSLRTNCKTSALEQQTTGEAVCVCVCVCWGGICVYDSLWWWTATSASSAIWFADRKVTTSLTLQQWASRPSSANTKSAARGLAGCWLMKTGPNPYLLLVPRADEWPSDHKSRLIRVGTQHNVGG